MTWTRVVIDNLERTQNRVGRVGLGGNGYVGTEAIRGEMGWSSFEERIDKANLNYKKRLEMMECNRWAKRVYIWDQRGSFVRKSLSLIKKYNFKRIWQVSLEGVISHWIITVEGGLGWQWDSRKWKEIIDHKVAAYGLEKWKQGMIGKSTLEMYSKKPSPRRETFYDGSFNGTLLFKARTMSLEINSRTYRWNDEGSKLCQVCGRCDKTLEHVLAECPAYSDVREEFMGWIVTLIGTDEWSRVNQNEDFGIGYILGLDRDVVEGTKGYLGRIWKVRKAKIRGD